MLLRFGKMLPRMIATLMAVVAVSLFFSSTAGQHSSRLHMVVEQTVQAFHTHAHSHDEDLVLADDAGSPEHHHADHSHEKADLVADTALSARHGTLAAYFSMLTSLEGSAPDGIERPPRLLQNIV
jgi:hypothetical protein